MIFYTGLSSKYSATFGQLDTHYLSMYVDSKVLESHEAEMSKFIEELHRRDKKIVVIIFPFIELLGPNYPVSDIHNKLKDYFKSQNVDTIDLLDSLKNSNWKDLVASKFDTHPNEKVHKIAADKLYGRIYPS